MKSIFTLASVFAFSFAFSQNVGINTTGANPDNSAMLDVVSTSRGILIPRVSLTASNAAGPITSPATSLLVYNDANAGAGSTAVSPGFYYWDGSAWNRFDTGNNIGDWKLTGNSGTTAGTNYLGTSDGQALDFRTNAAIRFRVANGDQVQAMADGSAASPFYSWNSDADVGLYRIGANDLGVATGGTERISISDVLTVFNESGANTDFRIESDGDDSMIFVDGGNDRVGIGNGAPDYELDVDGDIGGNEYLYHNGDANTYLRFTADRIRLRAGNVDMLDITEGGTDEVVVNNSGGDVDFRVEGDTDTDLFFVDGSTDRIGVSNTTPDGVLSVEGDFTVAVGDDGVITGVNANASGVGINGAGQGETMNGLGTGSGGAFTGNTTSLTTFYTTAGVGRTIYGADGFGAAWETGAWIGTGYRKIIGDGTVSTVVKDLNGERVVMNCPETPENLLMDYGTAVLKDGKAHVTIDPILSKNILVDQEHVLKVFVQLEGDCNGVYVTNKNKEGFDVIELGNGESNVAFSYSIVATMGDQEYKSLDGETRIAKYDKRWEKAPEKMETAKPINLNRK